jgi:hypothetical protein
MRNAAAHASMLRSYGDVLALQQMQLGSIQSGMSDGQARLYDRLDNLVDHRNASRGSQAPHDTRVSNKRYFSSRIRNAVKFRLPLMGWLAGRTWEIALSQSQGSWGLKLNPINYRAPETLAFRYVREGNITAVDRLLRAGELSIWDVITNEYSRQITLLGVRVAPIVTMVSD